MIFIFTMCIICCVGVVLFIFFMKEKRRQNKQQEEYVYDGADRVKINFDASVREFDANDSIHVPTTPTA